MDDDEGDGEDRSVEIEGYELRSSADRREENPVRCWLNRNAERHEEGREEYDRGERRLAQERYDEAEEILEGAHETFEGMRDDVENRLDQSLDDLNEYLFEELFEYLNEMSTGSAWGVVGVREGLDGNHGEAQELLDALRTRRDVAQDHLREVEDEIGRDWEPIFDFDCVPAPERQIQL